MTNTLSSTKEKMMDDLIARLESAGGGISDIGLTIAICEALDLSPKEWFGSKVEDYAWETGLINTVDGRRHIDALSIPNFLTSLDAALSLVERMLPNWHWRIEKWHFSRGPETEACLWPPIGYDSFDGCHASSPRALLIAMLRALQKDTP